MQADVQNTRQTATLGIAVKLACAAIFALVLNACTPDLDISGTPDSGPLSGKLFGAASADVLVVTLHGDLSNGSAAQYQYGIAERLAASGDNVAAFGLIRPGYSDGEGRRSVGSHTNRRDHYTSANNALVAQTIANLKETTGASRVIAIGHSGGAAQLGTVIGIAPGLIDSAILVSCPCNIPRWRQMRGKSAWPKSQSPHRFVDSVASTTRVFAVTGLADNNTSPALARAFVSTLQDAGRTAEFVGVAGAGHGYRQLSRTVEDLAVQEIRR